MRWVELFKAWTDTVRDDILIEYSNITSPIDIVHCTCKKCGYQWQCRADVIRLRPICPHEHKKQNYSSKILSKEVINERLKFMGISIDEYYDTKHYCKAQCQKCGHIWYPKVNDLLNGHGCPNCVSLKNVYVKPTTMEEGPLLNSYKFLKDVFTYNEIEEKVKIKLIQFLGEDCQVKGLNLNDDLKYFKLYCSKCKEEKTTTIRIINIRQMCPNCYNNKVAMDQMQDKIKIAVEDLKKHHPTLELLTFGGRSKKCRVKCTECGQELESKFYDLLRSQGCPKCNPRQYVGGVNPINQDTLEACKERFIIKAKDIHGDKFSYDKMEYHGQNEPCIITCKIHGDFETKPRYHLSYVNGGCQACLKENAQIISNNKKMTWQEWIDRCNKKWNNKYDYSLFTEDLWEGLWSPTEITIICPIHGPFKSTPRKHLYDSACRACSNHRETTRESFIQRSNEVHNNKYDYSLLPEIMNTLKLKINIICPEHGEFQQMASDHISGCGCPKCKQSHLERDIEIDLQKQIIDYNFQKRFEWLGQQSLDFYIPQSKIGIECQGSQHFQDERRFKDTVEENKQRDARKRQLCEENGIQLVYYLDKKYNKYVKDLGIPYFNDTKALIDYIQNAS